MNPLPFSFFKAPSGGGGGSWYYSIDVGDIVGNTSLNTNQIVGAAITLPAGTLSKLAVYITTVVSNPTSIGMQAWLKSSGAAATDSLFQSISTTGWQEFNITPASVSAGEYYVGLNILTSGGLEFGQSATSGHELIVVNTTTIPQATLPGISYTDARGLTLRAYVT